jgi:hypothetical protein
MPLELTMCWKNTSLSSIAVMDAGDFLTHWWHRYKVNLFDYMSKLKFSGVRTITFDSMDNGLMKDGCSMKSYVAFVLLLMDNGLMNDGCWKK